VSLCACVCMCMSVRAFVRMFVSVLHARACVLVSSTLFTLGIEVLQWLCVTFPNLCLGTAVWLSWHRQNSTLSGTERLKFKIRTSQHSDQTRSLFHINATVVTIIEGWAGVGVCIGDTGKCCCSCCRLWVGSFCIAMQLYRL